LPDDPNLQAKLNRDIDAVFPASGEKRGARLVLANPQAPIIVVTRDPSFGPSIVPHFFLASTPVDALITALNR
jgi:hypothetical protein